ncbi:hypothetical protein VAWG006_20720 [Aeromonas enteropelogenes]|nr:hypothetical protein VAWG006_20720 [Aeromonas enteropelogenes]BEE21984.1 hypothetical protein VAWG007_20790 [Aeromonas enteropelogenes]
MRLPYITRLEVGISKVGVLAVVHSGTQESRGRHGGDRDRVFVESRMLSREPDRYKRLALCVSPEQRQAHVVLDKLWRNGVGHQDEIKKPSEWRVFIRLACLD